MRGYSKIIYNPFINHLHPAPLILTQYFTNSLLVAYLVHSYGYEANFNYGKSFSVLHWEREKSNSSSYLLDKNNFLFPKFGENMSWNEILLNKLNVIIYLVDCTYVKKNVLEINVPWEILLLCFRSNSNCQEKNERNKGKGEKKKKTSSWS